MKPISRLRMRARSRQLQVLHRLAVQDVSAVGGRIEQAQNRQQRRLAAARRAGDRQVLALLDVEMNARQRVRLHFVGHEDLGHAVQAESKLSESIAMSVSPFT